ncbi:serine hydrolase domain-containing protein [Thalassiella azotivora]
MRGIRRGSVRLVADGDGVRVVGAEGGHGPDVRVEWGSLTKTVTATALEVLAADGALDPDAPLEEVLPGARPGTGITPRLLVEHRSGLPRLPPGVHPFTTQPYARFDAAALEVVLGRLDQVAVRPPGHDEEYSNLGYAVLGAVVAAATGGSWAGAVRRLVLEPVGLTGVSDVPGPDAVAGATRWGRPRVPWRMAAMAPAGGLWGTPREALAWTRSAVLRGHPVPACAAWQRAGDARWHNGATRDASVVAAASPQRSVAVIVHGVGVGHGATDAAGLELLRALAGGPGAGGGTGAEAAPRRRREAPDRPGGVGGHSPALQRRADPPHRAADSTLRRRGEVD